MIEDNKKNWLFLVVLVIFFFDLFIVYFDFKTSYKGFTFAMLDVGQGDAIFLESPTGTQVLIDTGPPKKVVNQLSLLMNPFDRYIDALIITNPDQDHIAGALDLLKNYEVGVIFEPGTSNNSETFKNLKEKIKTDNIPNILAKKGMQLDLGGGVVLDILFPDRDVSFWSTNDGSIVSKLSFKDLSIMLMGDATSETENILLKENTTDILDSDILKVGHHGSRSSSSSSFVDKVSPVYSLVSSGKENKYGHPHKDVLDTLFSSGSQVLRTDILGAIIFKSNGENKEFYFKK